jgi:phage-related holin
MIDAFKSYFEKRIVLVKLELIDVFANVASGLVSSLLLLILTLFILCMFSFAASFWLGQLLNNIALGFASVGLFYALFLVIYIFNSKDQMELKIKDQIVKAALFVDEKEKSTTD